MEKTKITPWNRGCYTWVRCPYKASKFYFHVRITLNTSYMIVLSRGRTKISRIYSYFAIYRFRSFIFMIRLYEVEAEFFLFLEKFIWKTRSFDRTRRQLHPKCNFRPHEFLHPSGWVDGKVIGGCYDCEIRKLLTLWNFWMYYGPLLRSLK